MAEVVVDATDHIVGRLCSYVAKLLLKGENVTILNAEKAMISGNKYSTIKEWHQYLQIGSVVHPEHGPYHPRRPDRVITRMIRGMVPKRKPKGEEAMKRLRVFIGVPEGYEHREMKHFEDAKIRRPSAYYLSVNDLSKSIGWSE